MRITENMRSSLAMRDLGQLRTRYARAAEEATTGQMVNRPSDDPTVAARMQRLRRTQDTSESIKQSLSMGLSDLELAEASLAEAGLLMQRAKEVALAAANGSANADTRQAAAQEIYGIRVALLGIANTQGVRGFIFAGSRTNQPAFDDAYNFQGDAYEHTIRSGPTTEVTISSSGLNAFTAAGGTEIFQDLEDLETSMNTNNLAGIQTSLTSLDTAHEQVVLERARTGVNMSRVNQARTILTNSSLLYEQQLANLGGADPAESLTDLTNLQNALQRSIGVANQMLNLDAFKNM